MFKGLKPLLLLFIPFLFPPSGFSSPYSKGTEKDSVDTYSWSVGVRPNLGFIFTHRVGMRHLINGHIKGMEVVFDHPTNGKKSWHQEYGYPSWGLGFLAADLGNPEVLGMGYALYPYLKFPLTKNRKASLDFRAGTGLGIVEKPFDRLDNYKNIAIGSELNMTFSFLLQGRFRISDRLQAGTGLAFTHFSNGAVQKPNLGINIPSVNAVLLYDVRPRKKKWEEPVQMDSYPDEKIHLDIHAGAGFHEITTLSGKKHPALSLMFLGERMVSNKSKLGLGLDFFYNGALRKKVGNEKEKTVPFEEGFQMGIPLGYGLVINKLSLIGQWGTYLKTDTDLTGYFYHRFGFRYYFENGFIFNGTLRTHFAKAEHIELGVGYRIL